MVEKCAEMQSFDNLTVADMPQLEVRDGILYFENAEQYFKTIAIVGNMNEEELNKWEQELGFVSLRSMQNKAMNELELVETERDDNNIISKYSNYIELTDDNEIMPIVDDLIYSSIANQDGIYITNEMVNKISKNYLIIGKKENTALAKEIDIKTLSVNDENFEYYQYYQNGSKSCDLDDYCERDGRRRCYVKLNIYRYVYYNNNVYTIRDYAHVHVWGTKKKTFGGWRRYNTNLSFWNGKYAGDRRIWTSNGWAWGPFGYYGNWSGNANETKDLDRYRFIHSYYTSSYPSWPVYKYVRMTASSRGVGTKTANLVCNP